MSDTKVDAIDTELERAARNEYGNQHQYDEYVAFLAGAAYRDRHPSKEVMALAELLKYYVENCELISYEPVGGDGAPTGYLPYPMEWTAAIEAIQQFENSIAKEKP